MSLGLLDLARLTWWETRPRPAPKRVPEPAMVMNGAAQAAAFNRETQRISRPVYLFNAFQLAPYLRPGAVAVDLGCGTGWEAACMAAAFPQVQFVGVELSGAMIAHFAENTAGLSNVAVLQDDYTRLEQLPDQSADVIWASSSLHHLPTLADLRRLARTLERVLKPDGQFYCFDLLRPRHPATLARLKAAYPRDAQVRQDYEHSLRAAFTLEELGAALQDCGRPLHLAATWPAPLFGVCSTFPLRRLAHCQADPVLGAELARLPLAQKIDFWQLNLLLRPVAVPGEQPVPARLAVQSEGAS